MGNQRTIIKYKVFNNNEEFIAWQREGKTKIINTIYPQLMDMNIGIIENAGVPNFGVFVTYIEEEETDNKTSLITLLSDFMDSKHDNYLWNAGVLTHFIIEYIDVPRTKQFSSFDLILNSVFRTVDGSKNMDPEVIINNLLIDIPELEFKKKNGQ